jgi:hypothetical protein
MGHEVTIAYERNSLDAVLLDTTIRQNSHLGWIPMFVEFAP